MADSSTKQSKRTNATTPRKQQRKKKEESDSEVEADEEELKTWTLDLSSRMEARSGNLRSAFSLKECPIQSIRKLDPSSFIGGKSLSDGGRLLFDEEKKANLHFLLGTHAEMIKTKKKDQVPTDPDDEAPKPQESRDMRFVRWLVKQARMLRTVTKAEVKRGKVGLKRMAAAKKLGSYSLELEANLVEHLNDVNDGALPEGPVKSEVRFPELKRSDTVLSTHVQKKTLKSKVVTRQASITVGSSHQLNMQKVQDVLTAPSLSWDWDQNDDSESDDGLKIQMPEQAKRTAFKDQLQRSMSAVMAKGLVRSSSNLSKGRSASDLQDPSPQASSPATAPSEAPEQSKSLKRSSTETTVPEQVSAVNDGALPEGPAKSELRFPEPKKSDSAPAISSEVRKKNLKAKVMARQANVKAASSQEPNIQKAQDAPPALSLSSGLPRTQDDSKSKSKPKAKAKSKLPQEESDVQMHIPEQGPTRSASEDLSIKGQSASEVQGSSSATSLSSPAAPSEVENAAAAAAAAGTAAAAAAAATAAAPAAPAPDPAPASAPATAAAAAAPAPSPAPSATPAAATESVAPEPKDSTTTGLGVVPEKPTSHSQLPTTEQQDIPAAPPVEAPAATATAAAIPATTSAAAPAATPKSDWPDDDISPTNMWGPGGQADRSDRCDEVQQQDGSDACSKKPNEDLEISATEPFVHAGKPEAEVEISPTVPFEGAGKAPQAEVEISPTLPFDGGRKAMDDEADISPTMPFVQPQGAFDGHSSEAKGGKASVEEQSVPQKRTFVEASLPDVDIPSSDEEGEPEPEALLPASSSSTDLGGGGSGDVTLSQQEPMVLQKEIDEQQLRRETEWLKLKRRKLREEAAVWRRQEVEMRRNASGTSIQQSSSTTTVTSVREENHQVADAVPTGSGLRPVKTQRCFLFAGGGRPAVASR